MELTGRPAAPTARGRFGGIRSPVSDFRRIGNRSAPVFSVQGFPLFAGLNETESQRLDEVARWMRYRAGDQIVDADDVCRDVYFVAEGEVRVVTYSGNGREVVHANLGPGDYFGELAMLGDQPRTAAVWAVKDALIAVLPPTELLELLRKNSEVAIRMLERLANVIRDADERIARLS